MPNTFHLIDPAARDFVTQAPPFELTPDTLPLFREGVLGLYAQLVPPGPTPPEERFVPGPAGAPDVRVLVHRPDRRTDGPAAGGAAGASAGRATNRFGWNALRGTTEGGGAGAMPPERLGYFSPALAEDVAGLPPTFIGVGSVDLFLEEDVAYALRLSRSGVPVELHVYDGGIHGFDLFPGALRDRFDADLRAAVERLLNA